MVTHDFEKKVSIGIKAPQDLLPVASCQNSARTKSPRWKTARELQNDPEIEQK